MESSYDDVPLSHDGEEAGKERHALEREREKERQTDGKLPVNTHTHFVHESRTYDII